MRRGPIHFALVTLAYLAAGAVVTAVVAAACALWSPLSTSYELDHFVAPRSTMRWVPSGWLGRAQRPSDPGQKPWTVVRARERLGPGIGVVELWEQFDGGSIELRQARSLARLEGPGRVMIFRAGWPFNCLEAAGPLARSERFHVMPEPPTEFAPAIHTPFDREPLRRSPPTPEFFNGPIDLSPVIRNFIPLSPVWHALIANSIVWALILVALVRVPRRVRGALRVRRGLCPKCAYPMGVSERCTECGDALPASMAEVRMTEGAVAPLGASPDRGFDKGNTV